MERVVNGLECCFDVQSGWKDAVWVCPACPYAKNEGKPCETLAPLLDDALALLKAQQPRVMTLEELDDLRGRGQAVYFQDRDAAAKCQDAFFICCEHNVAWLKGETYTLHRYVAEYSKTWRCWTSRPTDEQREATPWDVGKKARVETPWQG